MMYSYDELYHHGRLGQKWGDRNGPPYPLTKEVIRSEYQGKGGLLEKRKKAKMKNMTGVGTKATAKNSKIGTAKLENINKTKTGIINANGSGEKRLEQVQKTATKKMESTEQKTAEKKLEQIDQTKTRADARESIAEAVKNVDIDRSVDSIGEVASDAYDSALKEFLDKAANIKDASEIFSEVWENFSEFFKSHSRLNVNRGNHRVGG